MLPNLVPKQSRQALNKYLVDDGGSASGPKDSPSSEKALSFQNNSCFAATRVKDKQI